MAPSSERADMGGMILLPETNHVFLRRVTRVWHERVDAAYASHNLASREGLSAFLLQQARALAPLERRIAQCGAAAMLPDWGSRKREAAIAADLIHLGLALPPPLATTPFPSRLHGFGALYVLEGSKLGARVLLRTVLSSCHPELRAATRFLAHPNEGGWARFLAVLNGLPHGNDIADTLREGACTAFTMFLDAATARPDFGETDGSDVWSGLVDPAEA